MNASFLKRKAGIFSLHRFFDLEIKGLFSFPKFKYKKGGDQ